MKILFLEKTSVWLTFCLITLFSSGISAVAGEDGLDLNYQDWTLKGQGTKQSMATGGVELLLSASSKGYGYWLSSPLALLPCKTYRLSFQALAGQNGGSPEVGLTSYNQHLGWWALREWTDYTMIFTAPDEIIPERSSLRFGQYGMKGGEIRYRDIYLSRVKPEYKQFDSLELGAGEIIYDNRYQFITRFLVHGNHSRPLKSFQCAYNSNRWVFFKDDFVEYEHILSGTEQVSGRLELHIDWRGDGELLIEAASAKSDHKWITICEVAKVGEISIDISATLYPATTLNIRLREVTETSFRGDFHPGTIQVGAYRYFAELNKTFSEILKGETTYSGEKR